MRKLTTDTHNSSGPCLQPVRIERIVLSGTGINIAVCILVMFSKVPSIFTAPVLLELCDDFAMQLSSFTELVDLRNSRALQQLSIGT